MISVRNIRQRRNKVKESHSKLVFVPLSHQRSQPGSDSDVDLRHGGVEGAKQVVKGAGFTGPVGSGSDGEIAKAVVPDISAGERRRAGGCSPVAGGRDQMPVSASR